ncbi:tRNA pseudouridine32 synthase/23S rRNA pseudouridine746 synthase [Sphingobium sp. OAS761]|uniref:RluA family pseudouridine synthase n=1 Tax=Sphingobium sp. OAS761 TaxID=2817901 RepID=UPI0020A0CB2C|nr:RNA pseudouridine synthase [Sphingobium sp. OAS761]MCP1470873.1 tRNA pseudouridine32 synthase/23S rRNA pseudouridine746 synthase [Sphingobium sp. OAS761]
MALLTDHVLFLDGEAIIIDKPAGLPVDAPRDGSMSLENHLASLTFGFQRWPLPVHRLDRDTSGCLLLARNPKAHKRFAAAFEAGTVVKRYVAVIDGIPQDDSGTIALSLAKISSPAKGWRMIPAKAGKPAVTHWRKLAEKDGRALVAFTPETGRTHQIRVHAEHGLGFGILGDPVYGNGIGPMLLHSRFLSVPRGGKPAAEAAAPLPETFAAAGFGADNLDDASL